MLENNNQQPTLFDSKTLIAIVLIGVFYLGWQKYLAQKYPQMNQKKAEVSTGLSTETKTTAGVETTSSAATESNSGSGAETVTAKQEELPQEMLTYEDDKVKFNISSVGMAVLDFKSKNYYDRKKNPVALTSENMPVFALVWGVENKPVNFKITQEKNVFKGVAKVGEFTVERKLTYNPVGYAFEQQIKIENPSGKQGQFALMSQDKILTHESNSILFPSYESQDLLVFTKGQKDTKNVSRTSESIDAPYKALRLYSLGTHYFTTGILDESDILPDLKFLADVNTKSILHTLTYTIPQAAEVLYKQAIFIGPKSSESLKAINSQFVDLLDYGMLGFISKPMLSVMKWFYGLVGNWGVAIILLTILVRGLVLPFNLMSYKSMKGMQTIQPILTNLRERYKDDPVTLNREMMSVMKQHNANPLAGCLPMLLQIPIFFALYRVIGSSVELYQAPFFGWIMDLSLHDKFYVLPILMGLMMYLQQKMTPTTMDPTQAKILAFMPVIFSVFMLNLPAGLTLYMCISAVFGIIQQKTFMKLM